MGMFFYPIEIIGQMSRLLNRALSSAHRIFDLLDTEPQLAEPEDGMHLVPLRGEIEFREVTFGYDAVRQIIRGVSFRIGPGELIGLVGPSGSGKTTLINLLVRFYDVTGGEIRIDGVPLQKLTLGPFRRQVGMVLQDPFLFHGTIIENIRYGVPEALDEFELRTWSVQTRQGPRSFQTKLDEWPRSLENSAVIIRDLSGDFYQINDPTGLDPTSQKLVWAFTE
jgi:ATP-binding cassette subfamily B protein